MLVSRKSIQMILGILWFIDGLLQLKPQMFTDSFIPQVIIPTAKSQPTWISDSISWAANVVTPHVGMCNAIFAAIQLFIGMALMLNIGTKVILWISFVWTAIIWWLGEGFGLLLTGRALVLTGAPGAVLLYGLIGWAIFRKQNKRIPSEPVSNRGKVIARWSLGIIWMTEAVLQFQPEFLTPEGLTGAFTLGWMVHMVESHGGIMSIAMAIIELCVGMGILSNRHNRSWTWVSILLSLTYWWLGQSFGQMFTSLGTDPNSGPLLILLALCAYPSLFARYSPTNNAP